MSKIKSLSLKSIYTSFFTAAFFLSPLPGEASDMLDEASDVLEEVSAIYHDLQHLKTIGYQTHMCLEAIRLIRERGYDTSAHRAGITKEMLKDEWIDVYGEKYSGHPPINLIAVFLMKNPHLSEDQALRIVEEFEEDEWVFNVDDLTKKMIEMKLASVPLNKGIALPALVRKNTDPLKSPSANRT